MNKYKMVLITLFMGVLATTANAAPMLCETTTNNHMYVDDSLVSACVDAGIGNVNGNVLTDDFLTSGGTAMGYAGSAVTVGFTQTGSTGTFTINGTGVDAIGFKFGTGNQPDEWFIYDLVAGVTTGDWEFVNVFGTGGGLSHIQAYTNGGSVPEPGVLGLLGLGLVGMVLGRRRRMAA